jgi:hypothetical protein
MPHGSRSTFERVSGQPRVLPTSERLASRPPASPPPGAGAASGGRKRSSPGGCSPTPTNSASFTVGRGVSRGRSHRPGSRQRTNRERATAERATGRRRIWRVTRRTRRHRARTCPPAQSRYARRPPARSEATRVPVGIRPAHARGLNETKHSRGQLARSVRRTPWRGAARPQPDQDHCNVAEATRGLRTGRRTKATAMASSRRLPVRL